VNRQDPTVFVPLTVTVLVWTFVPDAVLNTWFLYQRFALFLLPFYAVIFCPPQSAHRGVVQQLWLPVLCWGFLVLHSERLLAFAKESAAFDEVLAVTQPGQRALSLIFNPTSAALDNVEPYWNFPVWYQAEKNGFVDFNAAGSLPPVVRYRPDRLPAGFVGPIWEWRHPKNFDWAKYQAEIYRYFFIRSTGPLPRGYFPDRSVRAGAAEIRRQLVGLRERELSFAVSSRRYPVAGRRSSPSDQRPTSMRQPFWRWRKAPQTWRVRIMCQRCGSLSGPAIGPASST